MDKTTLQTGKLLNVLYDQIFFPKKNLQGYIFRYGLTLIFALILLELVLLSPGLITLSSFLLVSIMLVCISAFLGNYKTGIILSLMTLLIGSSFLLPNQLTPIHFFELAVFLFTGILISVMTGIAKRVDLGIVFGERERKYLKQMEKLSIEKEQIVKELSAQDEFISIASHELRTPLTTTLLKLQTVLDNIRNVSLANFSIQNLLAMLESAEQQAQTLGKMINDLLNVSLIRNNRMQLEFEEFDLSEATKNIVQRFSEKAAKDKIAIEFRGASNLNGMFDRLRIEQVVTNLVSNALKYGQKKPIAINVSKSGKIGRITVKDEGVGISKDVQQKIFNLFERGSHNGYSSGLGIGLFVSDQIIKAHKGKLLINSSPGKGSTFIVELPLKPSR